MLRPASNLIVRLSARYAYSSYQTSPLDGDRLSEAVDIERVLSSASSAALVAESAQLRFNNTDFNTNYDNSRVSLRYSLSGARTALKVSAGEQQTNDGGDWKQTPFAELDLTRKLSSTGTLVLTAGRQYTNAASSFGTLQSGAAGGIAVGTAALTSGDYLSNYASGSVNIQGTENDYRGECKVGARHLRR